MLPGMAMAGAGAKVPIVLKSLDRRATVPVQYGGVVAIVGRTPGSTLSRTDLGGTTNTFYSVDDANSTLTVSGPTGSGKQVGDIESFRITETHPEAVNSPRISGITVTYT